MANLIITGIIDGDLGGTPKAIELTVIGNEGESLDLSNYSLALANLDGTPNTESAFSPSGTATVGQKIYVASEPDGFSFFFGFRPDFTDDFLAGINGDDAVMLYDGSAATGTLIDIYGVPGAANIDAWEYADSWAYRSTMTLPTSPGTFTEADWIIPGPNALEDQDNNAIAPTPFPVPTIYLLESDGDTVIGEGGTSTDTYDVVLSVAPTDTVVVTITPDAQTDVGNGAGQPLLLTFTSTNYNTPQEVTVTAVDDGDSGNDGDRLMTHTALSNDARYDSSTNPNNLIINISNPNNVGTTSVTTVTPETFIPPADITITESGSDTTISQGGGIQDTYEISLTTVPTETVTVTVTPPTGIDVGNGAGNSKDFIFNPTDSTFTQEVNLSATEDATSPTATITHSVATADSTYASIMVPEVTANILDPGVQLIPISTDPIAEGSSVAYYKVVLQTRPTASVNVTITADDDTDVDIGEGPANQVTLVFDPSAEDFTFERVVTVLASTDSDFGEGTHEAAINHFVSSPGESGESGDSDYNDIGLMTPLTIDIIDPGVSIVETDGTTFVSEGGRMDQYDIVLNTVPTAPVTVTITPIDAQVTIALTPADGEANSGDGVASLDIVFDPTLDGFDPATDLTQTITVIAADDGISEDEHTSTINHSITSTGDPIYKAENNIPIDSVDVTISGAAVRIDASNLTTVAEGTTTSYDIVLESKPSATVTVKVTPADSQTDVGSGAGVEHVLTFNPADEDFSFSQTVTVTAVANDTSNEGAHTGVINHTVESTQDAAYDGLTLAAVTVNIVEPGMTIVETGGITTVSELGVTDTYSVVLNSAPENEITISILTDDGETKITEINGETVTGVAELTFTPETFNVPQTVTVTGVDDGEVEEVHSGLITHTISEGDGAGYEDTLTLPTVTATVIDCFLTGTRLLTEMGERRVEELKMGDRLQTLDGSLERIKWIGIQTCHPDGHYHPLRTYPIRIKAGALGDNRPVRDLYVSPDHALLVEGLLINAGALENGESIVRTDPKGESFVYYHIELERHSLVMAEGTPAESYLPQKQDRDTFDNGEEYAQLYPHSNMQALMPMRYPRVSSKRQLPRYIAKHLRQIAKDVVLA